MRTRTLLLPLACLWAANSPAHALCWIQKVVAAPAGIELRFQPRSNVRVSIGHNEVPRRWESFWFWQGQFKRDDGELRDRLEIGESSLVELRTGAHHSGCRGVVERRDGTLGIFLRAVDTLPNLPPQTVERFLPAQEEGASK
ncbi:MAG TPA: hypothetical protein VHL79_18375 [Ramlibacter sp.]|jgi:hypothetical protein|nr:hypothetical protein [Ramlibacter sp.]